MNKHYVYLWLLLAVVLGVVMTVSFADDLTLGMWTPRKAPFNEALLAQRTAAAADSDTVAIEEPAEENPMDSTAQSILLIGDSMTFNLARRLQAYAAANGHTLNSVNWDSSSIVIWAETDTLDHFIREFQPTFVMVCLGSNELFLQKPELRRPQVEKILKKIGDRNMIWIGPPNWKPDSGLNDMLKATVGPSRYFMTNGMELERGKDHIHPTPAASAIWMDSIMRWMPRSAHPILNSVPPDSVHPAPNITVLKAKHK